MVSIPGKIEQVSSRKVQKVSEYDQEIPQSHTADQPTAPRGRAIKHLQ